MNLVNNDWSKGRLKLHIIMSVLCSLLTGLVTQLVNTLFVPSMYYIGMTFTGKLLPDEGITEGKYNQYYNSDILYVEITVIVYLITSIVVQVVRKENDADKIVSSWIKFTNEYLRIVPFMVVIILKIIGIT